MKLKDKMVSSPKYTLRSLFFIGLIRIFPIFFRYFHVAGVFDPHRAINILNDFYGGDFNIDDFVVEFHVEDIAITKFTSMD